MVSYSKLARRQGVPLTTPAVGVEKGVAGPAEVGSGVNVPPFSLSEVGKTNVTVGEGSAGTFVDVGINAIAVAVFELDSAAISAAWVFIISASEMGGSSSSEPPQAESASRNSMSAARILFRDTGIIHLFG